MDMDNPPKTITGSLVQQNSPPKSDPSEDEVKLGILLRLGSHYWPKEFTPSQAKHFLADYLDDLAEYPAPELEAISRTWRQNVRNKRFPLVAELLLELKTARQDAADASKYQFETGFRQPSRPLMWWAKPRALWAADWSESEIPK